ncbi:hypothetical protein LCGC14_0921090 [marine sediment metagenome]|uniref:Uncharacterized protein n=1 Tax=marine sediment metagenome TaxID=412755 RepID=A0A0F9NQZ4_9ZZZZ
MRLWIGSRSGCSGVMLLATGIGFLILMMGVFAWFAYRTGQRVTAADLAELHEAKMREERRRR